MMKKYLLIIALILALLGAPAVTLASSIAGARYWAVIQISNNSTATTNIATTCNISTQNLIDGNYLNAEANNCVIRTSSGADVLFMPSVNATYPWCIWVESIGADSYQSDILYTANSTGGEIRYFPGDAGMTVSDNASLEMLGSFDLEVKGWWDTDNGTDKNAVLKTDAFKLFVSPTVSENITATIDSGASVNATNVASGNHTVRVVADGFTLKIYVDGAEKDSAAMSGNVTDNNNDWVFLQNYVLLYMEYVKLEVSE